MRSAKFSCARCGDEFGGRAEGFAHECRAFSSSRKHRVIDTFLRHDLKLSLIRAGLVYCYQVRRARDSHLLLLHRIGPANVEEIRRTKGLSRPSCRRI